MAEALVRLACEACGSRYTDRLTVYREPTADGVRVIVELDEAAVTAWTAAHCAPYVIPTPVRV